MARQGITFEQVAAVADALAGEGQQPTIRAVREKLGDTGSPNTIHKHLTAWREARPVAAAAAPELPQALTAAIAAEIERAASRARGEIEGRLVQAQAEAAELAAAGEVLEGERDELAEQVPGEDYSHGRRLRAYVTEIDGEPRPLHHSALTWVGAAQLRGADLVPNDRAWLDDLELLLR